MAGENFQCRCCGKPKTTRHGNPIPEDGMCGMCHNRGGLCMHNMSEHLGRFHYSRPHRDDTGAEDPETCQWCLARFL